jgi:hypothetical protein
MVRTNADQLGFRSAIRPKPAPQIMWIVMSAYNEEL